MAGFSIAVALIFGFLSLPEVAAAQSFAGQTLRVQFWAGSDALVIQKYVVDPFVKETGARVVASLNRATHSGWDGH